MRKVLALILSVLTVLCMLSACGSGKKKINDSDAVKASVCEYVDFLYCGEVGALDYVEKDSPLYNETKETIDEFSKLKIIDVDEFSEEIDKLTDEFYVELADIINCHITETKEDKENATVTATVTALSVDEIENAVNSVDKEAIKALLTKEEAEEYKKNGFSVRYAELTFEAILKELEGKAVQTEMVFTMKKIDGDWKVAGIDK